MSPRANRAAAAQATPAAAASPAPPPPPPAVPAAYDPDLRPSEVAAQLEALAALGDAGLAGMVRGPLAELRRALASPAQPRQRHELVREAAALAGAALEDALESSHLRRWRAGRGGPRAA